MKRGKLVVSVQLPVSNHFDLLNPGRRGLGSRATTPPAAGAGRTSRDQGERGEFCAFQCETSSRKERGGRRLARCTQIVGSRLLRPEDGMSRASCCRRCRQIATAHPEQVPPEEDRHWSPEYLVFSQAFNNASMTFNMSGEEWIHWEEWIHSSPPTST